jgi:ATP synthase F1 gamma subunit
MISEKSVNKELAELGALGNLTDIYGEIASIRMKRTRQVVLTSRDFMAEVYTVFAEVFASYRVEVMRLVKKSGADPELGVTLLPHNGKTVALLLSANTGLYGSVVRASFDLFMDELRKSDVEVSIVGRVGRSYFLNEEPNRAYSYFELPDNGSDKAKLSELVRHLVQYEEIYVYFGQFQNVAQQIPTKLVISAKTLLTNIATTASEENKYVFEPSLERVLMFFETEIFASLLDQTVSESQLAKYASRILAMNKAHENIDKTIGKLSLDRLKIKHRTENRKQLNRLSSMRFWGG